MASEKERPHAVLPQAYETRNENKALSASRMAIALDFERAVSFLSPIPAFPFETIPQSSRTGYMQQTLLHILRFSAAPA